MFGSLKGRIALVTGASKGIGRGMALRFAEAGCRMALVARHAADLEKVADEIAAAGGTAAIYSGDVAEEASIRAAIDKAAAHFGGLDIVLANAGIFPAAKLTTMTAADFDSVIGTNLRGTFTTVSAALPHLKARGAGRIVVTSSITGPITGYPGWSHYGASKAGQLGFVRTAAIELSPLRVTINAVLPGNVRTEGLEGISGDYIARMEASIPQGRLGTVRDIANAALFFASDEAAYITGQTLVVDGGQVLPESLMALEEMTA